MESPGGEILGKIGKSFPAFSGFRKKRTYQKLIKSEYFAFKTKWIIYCKLIWLSKEGLKSHFPGRGVFMRLLPYEGELISRNFPNDIRSQKFMNQQILMRSKEDPLDRHIHLHTQDLMLGRRVHPRRGLRKRIFLGVLSGLTLGACVVGLGITLS
jgi:hypothetical protein